MAVANPSVCSRSIVASDCSSVSPPRYRSAARRAARASRGVRSTRAPRRGESAAWWRTLLLSFVTHVLYRRSGITTGALHGKERLREPGAHFSREGVRERVVGLKRAPLRARPG